MKVKEESEKVGLKFNIQKTKITTSGSITSWQIDGETVETVRLLPPWSPRSLWIVTVAMKLRQFFVGRKSMTNLDIIEKAREFQKTSTSALFITPKTLAVWITTNCGKILKRWESQTTLPAS